VCVFDVLDDFEVFVVDFHDANDFSEAQNEIVIFELVDVV
jgi:hypothetical protein